MFERFTDQARRVFVLAQEEAKQLGHGYIGTEHILVSLSTIEKGRSQTVAAAELASLGVSHVAIHTSIVDIIGRGESFSKGSLPFTPKAKDVLDVAARVANMANDNYINPEHILLAIIDDSESVATQILSKLVVGGLDLLRQRLI